MKAYYKLVLDYKIGNLEPGIYDKQAPKLFVGLEKKWK